jgi:diaminohydroxyphosphoribosylaminopyrimidine deaminase/5-amino-6-(5-phosphoribosylamino)uracil reductase
MRAALALARRGLGRVWPNPAVGCVLVQPGPSGTEQDGTVVGRGWTQPGGRPHAETEAIARAGGLASGATAYVSLEPCAHHGKTGPCADALLAAGIRRAVVAIEDPDPRVSGAGLKRLVENGIAVTTGVCAAEAAELNAGFLARLRLGRPLTTLKLATTLDGRIATRTGESRWITGTAARRRGHALRAEHDAILVGIGTALADDPVLTCRLPGMADRSPVRIVLDGWLRLPVAAQLVATAHDVPTWVVTRRAGAPPCNALRERGVEVIEAPIAADGELDLASVLQILGERGLTRLLCEGGSRLSAALLHAGLVDRIAWFRAASIIGGDGLPAALELGVERLEQAPAFRRIALASLDGDVLETYQRSN